MPAELSESSADESEIRGEVVNEKTAPAQARPAKLTPEDRATCGWDNCGQLFAQLKDLVDHLQVAHVGNHKSSYSCEWTGCPRKGLAQTSRFALISHLRSHTGEKPFVCTLPQCDKSFTRSDALVKHLRLQHRIEPPAPGRGGSRKRKKPDGIEGPPTLVPVSGDPHTPPPGVMNTGTSTFTTFKIEPTTHATGLIDGDPAHSDNPDDYDIVPPRLMEHFDPDTNLIMGRSPDMVLYLVMKAKYKYAMEQQKLLLQELNAAEEQLQKEMEEKEQALDGVLKKYFRDQADKFIYPTVPAPSTFDSHSNSTSRSPSDITPNQTPNGLHLQ